jgi:hypothetical protein
VERGLDATLDRVLTRQQSAIVGYVDRLRARPGATPQRVLTGLERRYLAAVTAIGAASGGVAAVPGAGTAAALGSAVAEVAAFVEASALFALGAADVYGLRFDDPEVRRALVLAVLLGETGVASIEATGLATSHWAPVLERGVNREVVARINRTLMARFSARYGARQGALALGRALPFGVGVGIGAAGNVVFARAAIRSVRRAFGTPPVRFVPRVIEAGPTSA